MRWTQRSRGEHLGEKDVLKQETQQRPASGKPAILRFLVVSSVASLIGIPSQVLLSLLTSLSPLLRDAIAASVTAAIAIPIGYLAYLGPLLSSPTGDQKRRSTPFVVGAATDITERRKAEEAQRESEENYRVLFENEVYAVCIFDSESLSLLEMNDAATRLFGYSREELLSYITVRDLTAEEEATATTIGETSHTESATLIPIRSIRRKDGTVLPVEVVAYPHRRNGRTVIYSIMRDISDRVRAEQALRTSEAKFRAVVENSHDGVILTDAQGTIRYRSPSFLHINGYKDSERIGHSGFETVHPDDIEAARARWSRMLQVVGNTVTAEYRILHRDGTWRWVETTAVNLLNNADVQGVMVVTRDITGRKSAEVALRKSEQLYRKLIDSFPDTTVHLLDRDLRQIAVGGSEMEKKRFEMAKSQNLTIRESFPKDLVDIYEPLFLKALNGEATTFELPYGGSIFSCQVLPVRDDLGNIFATTSISRNVTAIKQAEKEKSEMEKSLHQMQRLESLGILAGGIAHDFNNMLLAVFGFIELAENAARDERVASYLSKAMKGMDRARGLTQQLLTFSKGGSPVKRITALPSFVEECVQFSLSGTSLKSEFEFSADLLRCEIDKDQVSQVIQNIVINAVQAMPLGGTLAVSCQNRSLSRSADPTLPDGNYVVISIRDQGIGIPEEMLTRIFDPFFTTKPKGHGLGLAISYSIIQKHSGAIKVSSILGKGSAFEIWLPACEESPVQDAEASDGMRKGTGRILVMDDDEGILEVLAGMLEALGYSVVCTSNGAQTIEFFKSELKASRAVDGMILDLTVPGGFGGKEVAAEIRKLDTNIPLFVSSGYSDDPVLANPTEFGFSASIAKPFRHSELATVLGSHMRRRNGVAPETP
jgi:PAS domain S-box-containing protein